MIKNNHREIDFVSPNSIESTTKRYNSIIFSLIDEYIF